MIAHDIRPVPAVGTAAPEFSLPSTAGGQISLAEYRGKQPVLIAFFPLAFTNTCTKELCAFTDDFDQFAGTGVAILPISVDSKETLREYRFKYALKVDLLSDFRRDVSSLYGVLSMEKYYSKRSYFLVDKSGILRWVHVEENSSNRRENTEILAQIAALS